MSFFAQFLEKYETTPAECVAMLHTVSRGDAQIIEIDPVAAQAYASFHEMPPTQRNRIRNNAKYILAFLATHDRHFSLVDIYSIEGPANAL